MRWSAALRRELPALTGTAPYYPRGHLLLHGRDDFRSWPAKIEDVSPLFKAISDRTQDPTSVLAGMGVTTSDSAHPFTTAPIGSRDRPEHVGATLHPGLEVPFGLSLDTLPAFEALYKSFGPNLPAHLVDRDVHLLVCVHGTRDCRCGEIGLPLYNELVRIAKRRKLGGAYERLEGGQPRLQIHRVSHVGGHKYAANVLLYGPHTTDWYGLLTPLDGPDLINMAEKQLQPHDSAEATVQDIWWTRWRGRATLDKDAQLALATAATSQTGSRSAADLAKQLKRDRKSMRVGQALGETITLPFVKHNGTTVEVRAFIGERIMDAAKRADLVEATCGGFCECATCHVYLRSSDDNPLPESVPTPQPEEEDQLEFAIGANDDSRLACALPITQELADWMSRGGRVHLPRF